MRRDLAWFIVLVATIASVISLSYRGSDTSSIATSIESDRSTLAPHNGNSKQILSVDSVEIGQQYTDVLRRFGKPDDRIETNGIISLVYEEDRGFDFKEGSVVRASGSTLQSGEKRLTTGASPDQVAELLGPPDQVVESIPRSADMPVWSYKSLSQPVSVFFEKGKAKAFVIGEWLGGY